MTSSNTVLKFKLANYTIVYNDENICHFCFVSLFKETARLLACFSYTKTVYEAFKIGPNINIRYLVWYIFLFSVFTYVYENTH